MYDAKLVRAHRLAVAEETSVTAGLLLSKRRLAELDD